MRSIWKGSLTFGLVNIPIKLYSASRTQELKFKLLHKKDNSKYVTQECARKKEKRCPGKRL